MKTFKKNWNNRIVEDDGCYMSKEAKSFVTAMKNMLKRELAPYNINVLSLKPNHYDCSGFLEKDGYYVYISYSIPRYGDRINFSASGAGNGVLYREAENEKDFTGGHNHFCALEDLPNFLHQFIDAGIERNSFTGIRVGDHIICADEYDRDQDEHEMLITAIDETDSDGIILYGIDLTYGDSEEASMVAVHANEFIKRIKPDKQAFFFTFGTAEQFPYQGGYLIVKARNQAEAVQIFRHSYPDINENTVNCAFIYNEWEWIDKNNCCTDSVCHEIIA